MKSTIHDRVKELCTEKGTTLKQFEEAVGFANGSIRRWETNAPSIDKVKVVAKFFNVSVDYLVGESDIRSSAEDMLKNDEEVISFQRAREKCSSEEKDEMSQILRLIFKNKFSE